MGNPKEIGNLLRTLRKFGVKRFKNSELEIVFETSPTIEGSYISSKPKPRASSKAEKIAKNELEKEEYDLRKEQLELMKIEDPAMYEQLVAEGDLEDEQDSAQH